MPISEHIKSALSILCIAAFFLTLYVVLPGESDHHNQLHLKVRTHE